MEPYERLLTLAIKLCEDNQTAFAKSLGMRQSTLYGYLNKKGQTKIRLTLLDKVARKYPQVSREWLYFGEGEMLRSEAMPVAEQASSAAEVTALQQEAASLRERVVDLKETVDFQRKLIEEQIEENRALREKMSGHDVNERGVLFSGVEVSGEPGGHESEKKR